MEGDTHSEPHPIEVSSPEAVNMAAHWTNDQAKCPCHPMPWTSTWGLKELLSHGMRTKVIRTKNIINWPCIK